VATIQGFTRFRKWQVGKETTLGTAVAATRVLPYRGVLTANPNWTDPDVDTGSLDPIVAPYRTAIDATSTMTGKAAYDDLPYLYSGTFKGGVTPTGGGAAKTWTYTAASLTADPFETFTGQFGDDADTTLGGWAQPVGGTIEQLQLNGPDDLGAFDVNAQWRFADVNGWGNHALSGTVPTPALTVDANSKWMYLADTELYIDSTAGTIGTTKISDAVHNVSISIDNNLDQKRFANGSNARFSLAGYGRGARVIEVTVVFAKSTATQAEAFDVFSLSPVNRYVEIRTTAPDIITGSTHYSNSIKVPLRYRTRADGERNNNTIVTLVGRAFYDSTLTYAIQAVCVNALTAL
jgi:hypothetical protein